MRNIEFPQYDTPVERFRIPEDHYAEARHLLDSVTLLACDTETYDNPSTKGISRFIGGVPNNTPFCLSMTYKEEGEYISIFIPEECIPIYKDVLEAQHISKILHNSKFDMHMLQNIGIELGGTIWDTMIMIHLIDEEHMCNTPEGNKIMSKGLKNLAYHYLGENGHIYEELVDECRKVIAQREERAKSRVSYREAYEACPMIMKDYACSDTEFTYLLYEKFVYQMMLQNLTKAYDVDMNATRAAFEQERVGIKVDIPYYEALSAELTAEMDVYTARIIELIPKELNINSGRDLVEGFKGLGLEWRWFTDKGEFQTSDTVLKYLIGNYELLPIAELAELVLKYRENSKLVGTFISQIFEYVQWDGRIHPDFNVSPRDDSKGNTEGGTVTGRLSSSNPNLHNIPKDDKRIRKGLIPDEDFVFVEMDYSQQEYRLLAHYARDANFAKIVHDGKDIHAGTAELLLHVSAEESTQKKYRDVGKRLNFALVYGLGQAALANSLKLKIDEPMYKKAGFLLRAWGYVPWDMPALEVALGRCSTDEERALITYYYSDEAQAAIKEATRIKDEYFEQFPDIQLFLKDCIKRAKNRGWVKTWIGRRRHFKKPKEEGYKAPNAVIQGGCGDITKIKMWEVTQFLLPYQSRLINNIHDALLFEIHKDETHLIQELAGIMVALDFSVPMDCSIEISDKSWGHMADYEEE